MKHIHRLLAVTIVTASVAIHATATDIDFTTPSGRSVGITIVSDNIVKVTNTPQGVKPAPSKVVLENSFTTSKAEVTRCGDLCTIVTPTGVVATADTSTGAVTISAGGDRAVSDNGIRTISGGRQQLSLSTMGSGSFYGAGERGYSFNLAGDTLVMYNKQNYGYTAGETRIRQMNITMPLFISSAGYAVLFDDYAAAEMVMSNPIKYITESREPVSYYFINGAGSMADVTKELSALTGRQELPPFWSLGYITSKYGYHTQEEATGVIDTLKRNKYPVDGIVLDLYWYGKEQDMGRLAWDPEQWPDHRKMLTDLKDEGVNMVIISQPYVLRNGKAIDNYNYLAPKGMFVADSTGHAPQEVKIWVGEGGMFDVSNPDTRRWLRDRYKTLTDEGVTGWWGDLGEPEVHPETGLHANGKSAREYHNLYGNEWSSIIYDLFKEEYPDTRLMTMMRGGTIGLQRYSVFPWSTDVSRSWGGLQPQVTIMLNSGLSGLGYMSHDVGGFAIDAANPVDPELYVRWLQLGTFSPILRTHSQAVAEPYHYTDLQDIIHPLILERYRWLPYNYTLAYENASAGQPLVRPLNYYTPESSALDNITDQYLWGRDVMVAPVLTKGTTARTVIFPAGKWIDISNPANIHNGGDTINYPAPLSVLPMFVRAGAFIPQADYKMENTGDYRTDRYTINYYPVEGVESSYTMYEDDRQTARSLEKGEYALVTFSGNDAASAIDINATYSGSYPGAPASKAMAFKLHNVVKAPAAVITNGKKASKKSWKYNAADKTLTINANWAVASPLSISVVK